MRALIADDDRTSTTILTRSLSRLGLDVMVAHDGDEAWARLAHDRGFGLVILDWEMPGLDGLELCRRIRMNDPIAHMHIILATARDSRDDVIAGLDAGADDYLIKPFDAEELRARVEVGIRIVSLQERLTDRVAALEEALSKVKQLSGMLPICSYCNRIRSDNDYWEEVDRYVAEHSEVTFSHGVCPACFDTVQSQF
jgi:phosphoserine phosphatase RsbU/P